MMKLLILLVIVVGIIAVAQLAKVYRLSAELRGKRQEDNVIEDWELGANKIISEMHPAIARHEYVEYLQ